MIPLGARLAIAALVLAAAVVVVCGLPLEVEIETPRFSQPIVATPGERFVLTLRTSLPWWSPDWRVRLEGAEGSFELPVVERGSRGANSRLVVEIPPQTADSSEGFAYDLRVKAGSREAVRAHAVHVRDRVPSAFTLLHLADLVMLSQPGAEDEMARLIDEVNRVNPDLVLLTGDIAKGGGLGFSQAIGEWLLRIRAPTIVVPGNHAYDDLAGSLETFGPTNHVTRFGDWRIISVHSGHGRDQFTSSRLRWLSSQLLAEPETHKMVQIHHPLVGHGAVKKHAAEALRLIGSAGVALVFSGHIQEDRVFDQAGRRQREVIDFAGPKLVTTTAAGDEVRNSDGFERVYAGYRLVRIEDGRVTLYTHDLDGDGRPDPERSTPWGTVTRETPRPGTAVIRNGSSLALDARVEVETGFPSAIASAGEIVATERLAEGAWRHRVAIRIAPGGEAEIVLRSASERESG